MLLQFFVEPGKLDQGEFALESLKHAMKWDEDTYGLEVDLDQYNVVAVGDFNAGAMENKGLNIFNTKLVLARPDISTDWDFNFIDRTVAHEYFHNWTGNRVTCRDWFQLVAQGRADGVPRAAVRGRSATRARSTRIQAVRNLRSGQFPEDAGPMAHPVRPPSYQQISNFYTSTIYSKGAELVRMMHTLVGAQAFPQGHRPVLRAARRAGRDHRRPRAARCEDASGVDLAQFRRWYEQAGTPRLDVRDRYDAATHDLRTDGDAALPADARAADQAAVAHAARASGCSMPMAATCRCASKARRRPAARARVLSLRKETEVFRFVDVPDPPVPSLGRGLLRAGDHRATSTATRRCSTC